MYQLVFRNSYSIDRPIADVQNMQDAFCAIHKFLKDHLYKSYYTRYYMEENDEKGWYIEFDVGSWSEFFRIYFPNKDAANKFLDTNN